MFNIIVSFLDCFGILWSKQISVIMPNSSSAFCAWRWNLCYLLTNAYAKNWATDRFISKKGELEKTLPFFLRFLVWRMSILYLYIEKKDAFQWKASLLLARVWSALVMRHYNSFCNAGLRLHPFDVPCKAGGLTVYVRNSMDIINQGICGGSCFWTADAACAAPLLLSDVYARG